MGPPPRNCVHRLRSSLFDPPEGVSFFGDGMFVAFDLAGATSRVERARALLAMAGYADVAAARARFDLPSGRWLCRPCPQREDGSSSVLDWPGRARWEAGENGPEFSRAYPLRAALILGLCGPAHYAPDRPLVWSEARLSRCLLLHRPNRYYEESHEDRP